jgi:uncharacterized protein
MSDPAIKVHLVAAGDFHDIDYARLELLKLLSEHSRIRTTVASNYSDIEGIRNSDLLISYTCNLVPSESEQEALKAFVEQGGKWFALHGTNSILEFTDNGVACPERAPVFMETLGSQFMAHPPIQPFTVKISNPEHPLVSGIKEFETDDELYICKQLAPHEMLLHTDFTGKASGFLHEDWPDDDPRPIYYIRSLGAGEVLYLNLGHCRGHYDMQPMVPYYPNIEMGSWDKPEYYELLRRGIQYCAGL